MPQVEDNAHPLDGMIAASVFAATYCHKRCQKQNKTKRSEN